MLNNENIEKLRQIKNEINTIISQCDKQGCTDVADILEEATVNIRKALIMLNKSQL